jgi:hypothetical protein
VYEDYVLWFDVAVQDLVLVHLLEGGEEVADDEGGGLFGEGLSLGDEVEELSVAAQFHDDVDVELVVEVAVDLDDVGVVQVALYLQFADELY